MTAYVDLTALFGSEVVKGIVPTLLGDAKGLPEGTKECFETIAASSREAAVANDRDTRIVIARADDSRVKNACVAIDKGMRPVQIKGATSAYEKGDSIIAFQPGIIVAGTRALVERALSQSGPTNIEGLSLNTDEVLTIQSTEGYRGTLTLSNERFRLAGEGLLETEDMAKKLQEMGQIELAHSSQLLGAAGAEVPPAFKSLLDRFTKAVTIARDGRKLSVVFELREPPADQARDIGTMATLSVLAVRKYIANAKQAEARNVLGLLSRSYITWWEADSAPVRGKKAGAKKLVSFPATPRTIPKGETYASTEADWKAWQPLHFAMTTPQYFQYEIKAAKDGKSAEVIAHGDLNGDGKPSTFKLQLKVQGPDNRLTPSPSIEEIDSDE